MADGNGYRIPFEALLHETKQTGAALATVVETNRQMLTEARRQTEILTEARAVMGTVREDRRTVAEGVKAHITAVVKQELGSSERWWRRAFIVVGTSIVVANLLGLAVDKWLGLLK